MSERATQRASVAATVRPVTERAKRPRDPEADLMCSGWGIADALWGEGGPIEIVSTSTQAAGRSERPE